MATRYSTGKASAIDDETLMALKAQANDLVKAPWWTDINENEPDGHCVISSDSGTRICACDSIDVAAFIVIARLAVPLLAQELLETRSAIKSLRADIEVTKRAETNTAIGATDDACESKEQPA